MEIFLVLCALVGGVALIIDLARSGGGNSSSNRSSTVGNAPNRRTRISSAGTPKTQPKPFDAESAQHLPAQRIVQGAACVTDGDTIVINKTQIRLFGVDAPELDHPYGKKAKWAMVKLCKGHKIRAEVSDQDKYGRVVARCFLPDGRDLSAEMVKQGLAIDWAKFSGGIYRKMETSDARKKLWLADARQKGRMHVWEKFEANQSKR
ncbi:MAG: micrococcal nuclease [Candidatus Azotimanducaceae bacterium]|jgi:micrococcal nuclease